MCAVFSRWDGFIPCRCPRNNRTLVVKKIQIYFSKKMTYTSVYAKFFHISLFCHNFCNIYAKHIRFSSIANIYFPLCRHVSSNQFVLAYCVNQLFQLPFFRRSPRRDLLVLHVSFASLVRALSHASICTQKSGCKITKKNDIYKKKAKYSLKNLDF